MPPLSIYQDEDDPVFWRDHAYIRLRPTTRIETEPEQIILRNQVWFGSIASQDDIFEGMSPFEVNHSSVNLDSITALARRNMLGAPEQEMSRVAQKIFEELSQPEVFEQRAKTLIEHYRGLFRRSSILSLFRDPTVQRNWHEYASGGAGYGAVFDFREPWPFEGAPGVDGAWVPFPVDYVPADAPPLIQINAAPVPREEGFTDIKTALLTKSNEWRAQNEERLIRVGIENGLVEFPELSLRAMLLGYNCAEDARRRILALCSARSVPIPVFQTRPSATLRRLEIEQTA